MNQLQIARSTPAAAATPTSQRVRGRGPVAMTEPPRHLGNPCRMLDGAGCCEHHIGPAIIAGKIGAQVLVPEGADGFPGTEDRPADWLVRKCRRLQIVEYQIV